MLDRPRYRHPSTGISLLIMLTSYYLMDKALRQELSVNVIWVHTDSSIRNQAYMVANWTNLTDSYIINQTGTLSYRDTMRQFIVHAICYHDSTPALMLDSTHNAQKWRNASTHGHTDATHKNTLSFRAPLIVELWNRDIKISPVIMMKFGGFNILLRHTSVFTRLPTQGFESLLYVWELWPWLFILHHFRFLISSSLLFNRQVWRGRCHWIPTMTTGYVDRR